MDIDDFWAERACDEMRDLVPSVSEEAMKRIFGTLAPQMLTISLRRSRVRFEPEFVPETPRTLPTRPVRVIRKKPVIARLSPEARKRLAKRIKARTGRKARLRNLQRR